jgi:hypothetical protein
MRISSAFIFGTAVGLAGLAWPGIAHAAIGSTGPGAEQTGSEARRGGVQPGLEASGGLGTGFSGTYGFGYEGRIGYTLPVGVYVGGQVQAFYGQSVNDQKSHAVFFGAEAGYKWFPLRLPLELRPYVFGGPAFITQVNDNATVRSKTSFAVQPGALALYHLGPAFVGADFRFLAVPAPFGVSLFGMAGIGF